MNCSARSSSTTRASRHRARAGVHRLPRRAPRRLVTTIAVVAVAAAAAIVVIGIAIGSGGRKSSARQPGDSRLVALNALGGVSGDVALGDAPAAAVAADGSLWLASPGSGVVTRVADSTHTIVDSIPVGGSPALLAAGGGSIWVASALGDSVARVDPRNGAVSQTVSLGSARAAALTFGGGALWVADAAGDSLLAIDPVAGKVVRTLRLSVHPNTLAFADGTMWVADYGGASVSEVDLRTGQTVADIHVGGGPAALAVGLGGVWVANSLDSTVSRINPLDGSVAATIPVGSGPSALLLSDGLVWVANQYAATVSRIDPTHNAVVGTSSVGGGPAALAADAGNAWVAVRALVQHRGGTLTLAHTRVLDIDPAINVDLLPLQSDGLTRDGLVTYNHVPGPDGTQLIPDLAINLPAPTDGGTSYTFRLRAGIRYSDGRLVRASDFRLALERVLRLRSSESAAFDDVLGADACSRDACDLSRGVVPDNRADTVTFHLRSPDPGFLNSLATPQATAVPPGTPFHDVGFRPIPGTGPYEIAAAGPHEIRWIRNPFFHEWSHAAQPEGDPDQIVMRFGLSPTQEVRAIENGTVDWSGDFVPSGLVASLKSRFASQVHAWTIPTTDFVQFNTTRAPFNDIRVRHAFNLAVDRRHVAQLYGGSDLATPTCQILPPGLPGYRPYCPYAHDVARARTLVSASGTQRAAGDGLELDRRHDDLTRRRSLLRVRSSGARLSGECPSGLARISRGSAPRGVQADPTDPGGLGRHARRFLHHLVLMLGHERPRRFLRPPSRPGDRPCPGAGGDATTRRERTLGEARSRARRPGRLGPGRQRPRPGLRLRTGPRLRVPPLLGTDRRPALAAVSQSRPARHDDATRWRAELEIETVAASLRSDCAPRSSKANCRS